MEEQFNSGASPQGYSFIQQFLTCRKRFYYSQVLGLAPREGSYELVLGGAFHAGLAAHYSKRKAGEPGERNPVDYAIAYIEDEVSVFANLEPRKQECVEDVCHLLNEYVTHYHDENLEVLDVELEYVSDITSQRTGRVYQITGRVDLLARDARHNLVWIFEHKTSGLRPGQFFSKFRVDRQITGYVYGVERSTPHNVIAGVYVNACFKSALIQKPTAKQVEKGISAKTYKQSNEAFIREGFLRPQHMLDAYAKDVAVIFDDIYDCSQTGEWYCNTDQCITIFGRCPYMMLCEVPTLDPYELFGSKKDIDAKREALRKARGGVIHVASSEENE